MTKKTRIKTTALPAPVSRDQAESIVSQITELTIKHNGLTADLDTEIAAVRSRYEATLGNLSARIDSLTDQVRDWALANPEEFGKKKSLEFSQGIIGFRTGMPKLKTLSGFTFARVLHMLSSVKWGAAFTRIKEEVDKEGLISAFTSKNISSAELREIGVRVDQEETFFVDPFITETEGKQVTTAQASKEGK
jgi:phage host-nuclease inhibitor protein Gam